MILIYTIFTLSLIVTPVTLRIAIARAYFVSPEFTCLHHSLQILGLLGSPIPKRRYLLSPLKILLKKS